MQHDTPRRIQSKPPGNDSFTLKASTQTYEVSIPQLQKLFARELSVPEDRVTITASEKVVSSDPMDRSPTVYGFSGLIVTVKGA